MGDEMATFSERLKFLRTKENLTQKQLAEKLEISSGSIIAYEKAMKVPSIDVCVKIATFFNVSMDWLCGLTDDVKNYQIRTYGDAFRLIIALHKWLGVDCYRPGTDAAGGWRDWGIFFNDKEINDTLNSWQKIKALYDSETIDEDIYGLWIEKQLKELDKQYVFEDVSEIGY